MNNYTITFKSLRAGTTYTVSIGGGTGAAIPLKGGSQPFVTQEDDSEDMFTPIRTQTGYICIVDDGKDYNGNALGADWWKDMIPATDTSRPVSLTDGNGNVVWQGFMQAQTFSGVLYGGTQEREFPVQCVLSVLATTQISTNVTVYRNFAYLLDYIFGAGIPNYNSLISQIVIQGGADAREWLRMKFDWRNFLNISDGDVSPQYNLFQIFEDICRYWGWTARTCGQQIMLCAVDDRTAEPDALVLTRSELISIGAGTYGDIGTVETMYSAVTIGTNFASTNNEDIRIRGYSKAVVRADCNASTSEMAFAPQSVRDRMERTGYSWYSDPDNEMIGYFSTQEIQSFSNQDSRVMEGNSTSFGGFSRRQIYSEEDQSDPDIVDCIDIRGPYDPTAQNPKAWIWSSYDMSFPGGSFEMRATLYEEYKKTDIGGQYRRRMKMAIGIGSDREHAQWLNMGLDDNNKLLVGWGSKAVLDIMLMNIPTLCPCLYTPAGILINAYNFPISKIPVDSGLSGRVFVEFYGSPDVDYQRIGGAGQCNFEIADFTISFSRDAASIVDSRTRSAVKTRYSSREYSATASNQASDPYNVDCIFASDNDMDYGFGLLMNADGSFMSTAPYSGGTDNTQPERHLVDRIAAFYSQSRRVIYAEMQNVTTTPRETTTVDNTACYPVSISRDWRDDVTTLKLIQI